jgi:hypothetical protein
VLDGFSKGNWWWWFFATKYLGIYFMLILWVLTSTFEYSLLLPVMPVTLECIPLISSPRANDSLIDDCNVHDMTPPMRMWFQKYVQCWIPVTVETQTRTYQCLLIIRSAVRPPPVNDRLIDDSNGHDSSNTSYCARCFKHPVAGFP